jgi:hypothetical protein
MEFAMGKRAFCSTLVAGAVWYGCAFQVNAGGPSPVVFRAEATNPSGVGLVEITFEAGVWDPRMTKTFAEVLRDLGSHDTRRR